ncbi:isoniazid-induced protein IniB [Nilaparvata lugens]|uniref:isoniazid-induced protein IniB n=1 Tax=Nilaparvata lugens TaxID=108931 RepID=UPI00193CFADB|nr:isoniazid-induced protein IniB [Nilaparvata lugens]
MATISSICVGLLLVIQTVVNGQPVELALSSDTAGEAAAAAATTAGDVASAVGSSLTGNEGLGSVSASIGGMTADVGGMAANAGAIGTGTANGLIGAGTGLVGAGAAGLNAGLGAGIGLGAVGLGTGLAGLGTAIGTGTSLGELGAGALGAAAANGLGLLGSIGGRPIIVVREDQLGTRFGSKHSRRTTPGTVRAILAQNANDIVKAIDESTGNINAEAVRALVGYGQAMDAMMGVESGLGGGVATAAGQLMTNGRDGSIIVLQDGVDRIIGLPASVSVAAGTPDAIVVG